VAEKGTNPSPEADIIIASKICPTSSSSIPPSCLECFIISCRLQPSCANTYMLFRYLEYNVGAKVLVLVDEYILPIE
jgi:hypothetical protein